MMQLHQTDPIIHSYLGEVDGKVARITPRVKLKFNDEEARAVCHAALAVLVI